MGLVFVIIQAANRFEIDKPENVDYIRAAYGTTQVIQLLAMLYIYRQIQTKKDSTPMTYTEPKNPMDPSDVEVVETTIERYDMKQLSTQFFQFIVGLVILGAMHFHWGYIRPLTLQVVLGLKTLAGFPLVQVHVFGQPAVGSLARPWKPKGMFGDAAAGPTPKEQKAKEKKEQKKKLNRYD